MSIFDKLLEYEDHPLQGIPLNRSKKEYDPSTSHHHRYHKTQAGLYMVLPYLKDGSIQKLEHTTVGSASISLAIMDGQDEALPDLFAFKSNLYHFDPAFSKSVAQSTTYHHSGIKIVHVTDSRDETILSVELSGWTKFEDADLPTWRLRVQRNHPGAPYRSNSQPAVEGNIFSYQKQVIEPDGRIKIAASRDLEGKRLDFEGSLERILDLMELYIVSRNRKSYAEHLNSPGCLIFK
ncbi:MAG: hypothetical protein Q7S55_01845 [Nanoarchaeota archaeon]|nr:hypothetical protein [Nanoarchaeota archaeon]